jgi:hypothetical protein
MLRRRNVLVAGGVSTATLMVGCAGLISAEEGADALLERAQKYWELNKANDNLGAWPYEDVSLDPRWTLQGYLARGGAVYDAVRVLGLSAMLPDGKAELDVEITFSLPALRLKGHKMNIKDPWRKINGRWYHELRADSLFR